MTTPLPASARAVAVMQGAMHGLFVLLLLISGIKAMVSGRVWIALAATLVIAAVYAAGLMLERGIKTAPRRRSAVGAQVWITVLVAAWLGALTVNYAFAWVAFALYFLILHIARPMLRVVLVGVTLAASVIALIGHVTSAAGAVIGPVMGALVALGMAWIYQALRREAAAHTELVAQLLAAQDDVFGIQESLALAQHRSGVLSERERIARDIHDTLAQDFSSILLLARAGLAAESTPEKHAALFAQIENTASTGLIEAREVVYALTPQTLASPLSDALQRLAQRLHDQMGLDIHVETEGRPLSLPNATETALLRIAQGAFANIRTHSQATRARVTLDYSPAAVSLEIIDDGVGFDPNATITPSLTGGFGLRAIRERASEIGGRIDIESAPGEGCAIIAVLPILPEGAS